jgi:hypothetical protein
MSLIHPWEADAGGLPEPKISRPAWAIVSKRKRGERKKIPYHFSLVVFSIYC